MSLRFGAVVAVGVLAAAGVGAQPAIPSRTPLAVIPIAGQGRVAGGDYAGRLRARPGDAGVTATPSR